MTERRFEKLFTWTLLVCVVTYGAIMSSYPSNAGRIPVIVAGVAGAVLVVQLLALHRSGSATASGDPVTNGGGGHGDVTPPGDELVEAGISMGLSKEDVARVSAVEVGANSYSTLLAVSGLHRRRLIIIAVFAVAFYLCILLVGFVVASGVLIAAILAVSRERIQAVILGGVVAAAAAYVLVVLVMGISPLQGYFFE